MGRPALNLPETDALRQELAAHKERVAAIKAEYARRLAEDVRRDKEPVLQAVRDLAAAGGTRYQVTVAFGNRNWAQAQHLWTEAGCE